MRIVTDFNQNWLFAPTLADDHTPDQAFEPVTLPHTNKRFSSRFVDNADYQFVSTYRKHFRAASDLNGKRVFLDFDGVMLISTVCLNGKQIGIYKGGYSPFSYDITDDLIEGENVLTVYVDSTEDKSVPPFGALVDYLTFGGIYRDVYLRVVDATHTTSTVVRTLDVLTAPRLEVDIHTTPSDQSLKVEARLQDAKGNVIAQQTHAINDEKTTLSFNDLNSIALWSIENPTLYTLTHELFRHGEPIDQTSVRFGFRTAEFCDDGRFYLNGLPIKLFGLNRHQTYPYIGAAAPRRLQERDADILKHELGCNVVRTSHYPQSPHFLNRCDEIGLLVFEELAGWQHIGDQAWKSLVYDDIHAMIERDRHHPSIILWGVRVNESPDDAEFYQCTNMLAHQLDPSRQTGGVRNFIQSQFLEDVFTLNDFPDGIQTPLVRPHLITEFGGHMFPTKTWDHEERRVEHALHHARKHNLQYGHTDIAGAIGWCAFDYYTHKEFGSGDRVCYHGVMDIYRLPKMAAYFYRSQKAPSDELVLYAATNWTMGDRSAGGNNPLTVFSNCDEIDVFVGDLHQGRFQPDFAHYPHLKHPPFTLRWAEPYNPWGLPFHDLRIIGYLEGKAVAQQQIDSSHRAAALRVTASTPELNADGVDMAQITVQIVDKHGNVLPYQMRVVHVRIEGDAELIGDNPLVLLGGQSACYLKAGHTSGTVTVHVYTDELPAMSVTLHIRERETTR